ncbi:hypothetical protein EDC56_1271 [Sinobacterium caligoides]|uniref:Uncharacterized protein n=2 Tax=Sinobacterium caligoides TaxID=933926 RepID=A0A3N2E0S2_9GAMM|nr:hypothetical protein EDC56_1271 [Sinobacterium caligoides]
MPLVNITNDPEIIKDILNQEFITTAGTIESSHFKDANHIIYSECDDTFFQGLGSQKALAVWLHWLGMLIKDAWLIKDHAIECDIAYCNMKSGIVSEWSNNSIRLSSSFSSGVKFKEVTFSLSELAELEEKSFKLQSYLHQKSSSTFNEFVDKQFSRTGRALRFISAARTECHPAIKISHYCSALESLFSTDSSELVHKLSERIAIFLKDYGYDPCDIFDEIKSFYGIRSKVTHGDSIQPKKIDKIPNLSVRCDELTRVILNIILNNDEVLKVFDGKKDDFEKHFKNILLNS